MTDKNEKKKKKKRRSRKSDNPDEFDEKDVIDDDDDDDPMKYFQKMMDSLGKRMGVDFSKVVRDLMKQFYPDMEDMDEEELQKFMKENLARMGAKPVVFGFNMTPGKDGFPKFERFGNVEPKPYGETVVKDEREPLVDIMEEENEVIVVAEIPGCAKENIELKATDSSLTIIACDEEDVRKYNTTVDLPSSINPDHARARYRNGILEVKLEKVQGKHKGKKISVD
ncbi:MAG: Hsp20/alpha crystallin family protein [Candidatus Lokiarchaeota archaeon]|nr:Hsp20/alpha crystallin family protein [Candidatus Lokiarchaeota archaeon]